MKLKEFIRDVHTDMQLIVSGRGALVAGKESYQLIADAWKDVEPRFQEILDYLDGKRELDVKLEETLQDRGLAGSQLDLKLGYTTKKETNSEGSGPNSKKPFHKVSREEDFRLVSLGNFSTSSTAYSGV